MDLLRVCDRQPKLTIAKKMYKGTQKKELNRISLWIEAVIPKLSQFIIN
ncbi:MAG TPA: hypothetical protein V6C85_21800 [Allocoleopsis sp.]